MGMVRPPLSDEEVQKRVEEMKELFGKLPNPFHEPVRFAYYVKMYRYFKNG